jgi:hypothetical protein
VSSRSRTACWNIARNRSGWACAKATRSRPTAPKRCAASGSAGYSLSMAPAARAQPSTAKAVSRACASRNCRNTAQETTATSRGQARSERDSRPATVPGLPWKVWGIDEAGQRASGVYLFADAAAGERYFSDIFTPHMGNSPALTDIVIRRYAVMAEATRLTRGPVQ